VASPTSKQPTSFADGVQAAMQDLAAAMSAPDADLHFGTEMIKVMGTFIQQKNKPQQAPPPGGGGSPPGGGGPPGLSSPGGPAGGGAQNPAMQNQAPPTGPGSGPTPGLKSSPDEMRRTLQEVAGQ
jgi:hypothetical protein